MEPKFNVDEWLKTIDIWDEKYDYVMHNSHWLMSDWSDKCPQCLAKGKPPKPKPVPSSSPVQPQPQPPASDSLNSTHTSTVKHDSPTTSSPPPNLKIQPPQTIDNIIPVTPIAPTHMSNKTNFVTPKTSLKFNDTFTRSTRQSTRKLLNQNSNQDLINLNETFDLYKSALAETPPESDMASTNGGTMHVNGSTTTANLLATPLLSTQTNMNSKMVPPKPRTNFELLTRIPVRSSKHHDY